MLAEGIHLYIKIVKVYGAEESRLRYYLGIGWGLPIPVVVITAGIKSNAYSSPTRYGVAHHKKNKNKQSIPINVVKKRRQDRKNIYLDQ